MQITVELDEREVENLKRILYTTDPEEYGFYWGTEDGLAVRSAIEKMLCAMQ
jgi:hypothetical protein